MNIVPKNRQEVLETIANTTGNILLHGDRGIGKTTFATEVLPEYLDKSRLIYMTLWYVGSDKFDDFLDYLGMELTDLFSLQLDQPGSQIEKIIRENGPVTIVIDEWEAIFNFNQAIPFLFELAQIPGVRLILIGYHLLTCKKESTILDSLFTSINLLPFTYQETVEIIAQSKVTLTEGAKKKLHEITTGHGFFLNSFLVSLYCEYADQLITENEVMVLTDTVKKSVRWKD